MVQGFALLAVTTLCGQLAIRSATGNFVTSLPMFNKLRGKNAQRALPSFTEVDDVCKPGHDTWEFHYTFKDGCVLKGFTATPDLTLKYCDGTPIKLDISCSSNPYDKNGFSTSPDYGPSVDDKHAAVDQFTIKTLHSNSCDCSQYCAYGTTDNPSTGTQANSNSVTTGTVSGVLQIDSTTETSITSITISLVTVSGETVSTTSVTQSGS